MLDLAKEYAHVFNSIDGFFIIDIEEKVVFMAENLVKQLNYENASDVVGRSIRDVIPTNKAYRILQTGEKQIGQMYFVEGYSIVSNGYPIYVDGELAGALEYDAFADIGFIEEFIEMVDNISNTVTVKKRKLPKGIKAKYSIEDISGHSKAIEKVKDDIKIAARSSSTVLITGETGTGKELVAHSIHKLSHRSLFHFVSLNCAAIPNELFESELFGYEEGSFTGARKNGKLGKVEIANNGSLFLDEIDNLTMSMQAKVLRFLQEKEIYHIGGDYAIPVNTRIIAATNQNPAKLVEEGKFREDLYYRLNIVQINVPPLRERLEDIPDIVSVLLKRHASEAERGFTGPLEIEPGAIDLLMSHNWPGNIRELGNTVERAVNRCNVRILREEDFVDFREMLSQKKNPEIIVTYGKTLSEMKKKVETFAVEQALIQNNQNVSKAAEELGISRQMLHRKLKEREESKQKLTRWSR